MDDLGLWCNYGQLQRDMIVMYQDGYWKKLLSKEEYDSLPWKKIDDVDASAMQDFLPRIAYRKGEFGKWLGETTPVMLDHFGIPVKTWSDDHRTLYWSNGHPKHHTNEDDGQLGCVLNCMWNRDPMAHAHVNFTRSGLPIKEMKHIAKVTWGDESAVDQIGDYTPTNTYKMKRLQWVIARTELHNMLGLCSWMAPWEYCPDEKNQYVGDPNMEAKIFSAVTGVNKTGDDLDKDGIRAWMLQRVYTMRQLGSSNMRKDHDLVPGWIYTDPKDRKPFTKGTVRMDPDDINKSFDIFFEQVGCDKETGVPTTDTLKAYRLDFVIPVLQKNIYELPLFKAHVLLLADIVADFSGRTELAEKGKVKELFLRQVKTALVPDATELQAAAETSTDAVLERALKRKEQQEFEVQLTPQGKVDLYEAEHPNLRPSRKALSRREMLRSLVRGDIHPSDLQTEEELEEELPEDYFETVCKATEEGDLGVFSITAPDGAEYLYFKPLMSHSYARILAVKDNAEALVCDQIRENSRIYPRPVPSQMFLEAPFDFDVPTLECLLQSIGQKEENKDIKFTQTSSGTIFLYSDKYLDDDLAEFLAEEQEMRPLNP